MPTFCSKIFHWGSKNHNGKKESKSKGDHKIRGGNVHPASSGSGSSKNSPLQFQTSIQGGQVYPETIDEGESCPYWTHMSCSSSQDGSAPKLVHAIVQPFYSTTGSSVSSGSRYDLRVDSRTGSRAGSRPHTPGGGHGSMSRPMSPSSRPHTPGSVAGSVVSGSFCGSVSHTPPPLPPHHPCSPIHHQPSAGVIRSPPGSAQYHHKTIHRANQHSKFSVHQSPYHTPFQSPIQSPAHSLPGFSGRNSPHYPPNGPLPPIPSQSPVHHPYNSPLAQTQSSRSHQTTPYHSSQHHIPPPPQSPLPPIPGQSPQHSQYTLHHQQQAASFQPIHNSPHQSPLRQNPSLQHTGLRHSSSHHNSLHRSGSAQFAAPGPGYHSHQGSPVHYPSQHSPHHQTATYHTSVRPHSSRHRNASISRDARLNHMANSQANSPQFESASSGFNSSLSPSHSAVQGSIQNYPGHQSNRTLQRYDSLQSIGEQASAGGSRSQTSTPGVSSVRSYQESETTIGRHETRTDTSNRFHNYSASESTKSNGEYPPYPANTTGNVNSSGFREDLPETSLQVKSVDLGTASQVVKNPETRYTKEGYIIESNYSQPLGTRDSLPSDAFSPTKPKGNYSPFPPPPQRPPPPPPSEEGVSSKGGGGLVSVNSSRSSSPATAGGATSIPPPRGGHHNRSNGTNGAQRSSLRGPATATTNHSIASPYHVTPSPTPPPPNTKQKDSMLDKFKLFNNKEKDAARSKIGTPSKRTSSSSGFSSARSERSDSSASLCSDNRPPPPPPHHSVPVSTLSSSSSSDQAPVISIQQQRGIRSRFSRSSKDGKESPRSSRRSEERDPGRGSPRSANRREREKDPREREKDGRDARSSAKLTLELNTSATGTKDHCLAPLQEQQAKVSKVAALTPSRNIQNSSANANHSSSSNMVQSGIPQHHAQVGSPGSPLAPGTGIPKPTAAVKGTAKSSANGPTNPNMNQISTTKDYPGKGVGTSAGSSAVPQSKTRNGAGGPTHSASAEKSFQGQPFESKDMKGSLTRQKQLGRSSEDPQSRVTVALVSPMPAREMNATQNCITANNMNGSLQYGNVNGNQVTTSESASTLSEASQHSGHSNNSNSSGSSVIYRPTSSEDDLDLKPLNKHVEHHQQQPVEVEEVEDASVLQSIKPMQPLLRPTQYMRGIASLHGQYRMGIQETNTVPQKGMRVSPQHPRRSQIGMHSPQSPRQQHLPTHMGSPHLQMRPLDVEEFADMETIDIANGYMSDGDVLRPLQCRGSGGGGPPHCDLEGGYLSEGGASLYAHKINQRFKEGIRQAQDYMRDDSEPVPITALYGGGLSFKNLQPRDRQDSSDSTATDTPNVSPFSPSSVSDRSTLENMSPDSPMTKSDMPTSLESTKPRQTNGYRSPRMSKSDVSLLSSSVPTACSAANNGVQSIDPISKLPSKQSKSSSMMPSSDFSRLSSYLSPEIPPPMAPLSSLSSLPSLSTLSLSAASITSSSGGHHLRHGVGDDFDGCGECDGDTSDFGDGDSELNLRSGRNYHLKQQKTSVSYVDGSIGSPHQSDTHDEDLQDLEMVVGELEEAMKLMHDEEQESAKSNVIRAEVEVSGDYKVNDSSPSSTSKSKSEDDDYDSVHDSNEDLDRGHQSKLEAPDLTRRNTVSFDLLRKTEVLTESDNPRRSLRLSRVILRPSTLAIPSITEKLKAESSRLKPPSCLEKINDKKPIVSPTQSPSETKKIESTSASMEGQNEKPKKGGLSRLKHTLKRPIIGRGGPTPPSEQSVSKSPGKAKSPLNHKSTVLSQANEKDSGAVHVRKAFKKEITSDSSDGGPPSVQPNGVLHKLTLDETTREGSIRENESTSSTSPSRTSVATLPGRHDFDDSSSLSSGVSDSLNEVCGGDDPLAPLTPLTLLPPDTAYAKARGNKEVGLKLPVGLSGGSRKVALDSSRMYKVVSSKAHVVKKTESAQQTDSSAFKQISNTQWKKYVDNGKDQQRVLLDTNNGSSSSSSRRLEQKKPGVLGSPSIPNNAGFGFGTSPNGVNGSQPSGVNRRSDRKSGGPVDKREGERGGSLRNSGGGIQPNGDNSKKLQNPKTAPSNFGYNGKRTSISSVSSTGSSRTGGGSSSSSRKPDPGSAMCPTGESITPNGSRREGSSHSLERPRTKIKVSGGTQTTNDLQYMQGALQNASVHSDGEYSSNSLGRKYQVKSYSLNGPAAAQLSQNVRERIMQSPYGKVHIGTTADYSPFSSAGYYSRERSPRMKPTDGSLSDSPYTNYGDIQYSSSPYSSPYMWAPRGNYPGSVASAPTRPGGAGGSLTEAESLESVSSSTASLGLSRGATAGVNSLTHARLLRHQREMTQQQQQPPLARSNSVRSTKSEKIFSTNTSPAMMSGGGVMMDPTGMGVLRGLSGDHGGYITSQPTSPTPPFGAPPRLPMSPLNSARGSPYYPGSSVKGKDEDCHGSSLSLVSSSSSLHSAQDEQRCMEVRRLRRDLCEAQDRVHTLATQLSTNAHVVAAFEHSLTNMTNRLQRLTATSERKDSELTELRKTIEALRQQSIDAGLTAACLQSMSALHHTLHQQTVAMQLEAQTHMHPHHKQTGGHSSHKQKPNQRKQTEQHKVSDQHTDYTGRKSQQTVEKNQHVALGQQGSDQYKQAKQEQAENVPILLNHSLSPQNSQLTQHREHHTHRTDQTNISTHNQLESESSQQQKPDKSLIKSFTGPEQHRQTVQHNRQSLPPQHLLHQHNNNNIDNENNNMRISLSLCKSEISNSSSSKPPPHPFSPSIIATAGSPSPSHPLCGSPSAPSPHASPLNSPRHAPYANLNSPQMSHASPFHCNHLLPKSSFTGGGLPAQQTTNCTPNPHGVMIPSSDIQSNSSLKASEPGYLPQSPEVVRRHTYTGTVLLQTTHLTPSQQSHNLVSSSPPNSYIRSDSAHHGPTSPNQLPTASPNPNLVSTGCTAPSHASSGTVLVPAPGSSGTPRIGKGSFRNGDQLVRGTSMESVSSLSSACSGTSHASGHDKSDGGKSASHTGSGKKKGWLRSSFTKAFSRGHKKDSSSANNSLSKEARTKSIESGGDEDRRGSVSDAESRRESCSVPNSPLTYRNGSKPRSASNRHSSNSHEYVDPEELEMLEEQLREQDMALTDIRLEALTSAHQLESLKETINKMRSEMICLKQDNERLQKMVASKSLTSSQSSLPTSEPCGPSRLSSLIDDTMTLPEAGDLLLLHPLDKDGKKVDIAVFLGCHGDYGKYLKPAEGCPVTECVIGAISISNKSKWDILDGLVKRIFKEYLLRVDPVSGLGLNSDSVVSYHLGEAVRGKDVNIPELLPCGYLVGEVQNIKLVLRGAVTNCVDSLAFETLIPKSIVQRYVSLLTEHRRIILCGPPGTGKTYLAQKLAEFLVTRLNKDPTPGNIATFNVDPKNSKDLGSFLSHISEQCEVSDNHLPLVIILDNLHHAGALTEVFNGFLSAKYTQCPYIIGTMNQATSCSTTNLQLHHNFRWVLMANHMEPVKGVLSRVARRRLTQAEVHAGCRQPRLQRVLDWLPQCWQHVNKFLETHSSSDVTLGPRLFLSCPGSVEDSQVWFTDLWNYSLVPYLLEAVKEGLQLFGKRTSWEDPCAWLQETYPWPESAHTNPAALTSLTSADVGYDQATGTVSLTPGGDGDEGQDADPLFNMLMRLQEAANYSTPQQDTTPTQTVALENIDSALESTL